MKAASLPIVVLFVLFFVVGAIPIFSQTGAKVFTVNTTADTSDVTPGDRVCSDSNGQCSFRAAIEETRAGTVQGNTVPGDIVTFALQYPAVIDLTGPLTIFSYNISIVGPGARKLTIRSQPGQKFFSMIGFLGSGVIRGVTLRDANGGKGIPSGALLNSGTLQLIEVSFIDNSSSSYAAGIHNSGDLTIMRSLFRGNSSYERSGAIHNTTSGTIKIFDSTFSGNGTSGDGGAIWNGGNVLLVNCTLTQNISVLNQTRTIFNDAGGTVAMLNTIIDSTGGFATGTSISGAFTSLGNNIVTDDRGSTGFSDGVIGDRVSMDNSINPMLAPLADNGGQTDTHALLNGSPAVNAGNSCVWNATCPGPAAQVRLFWDQRRGFLRGGIFNPVDIGAYEVSTGSSSSSSGFVTFPPPGPAGRLLGSIAELTNVATNEKRYYTIGPFGRTRFQNLGNDVYVLEIKSKRSGGPSPQLIAFPD